MKFYKYQRSRSFTDLCPGCLRFNIFKFSSIIIGLFEVKLHVVSLGLGNKSLCMGFGSHNEDGGPYMLKLRLANQT